MTGPSGKRLRRADHLTTRDMGKNIIIGGVEGQLASVMPVAGTVHIGLIVGGSRAWFTVTADTHVDVWGSPRGATP